jgi:hypothetical protein
MAFQNGYIGFLLHGRNNFFGNFNQDRKYFFRGSERIYLDYKSLDSYNFQYNEDGVDTNAWPTFR